VYAFFDVHGGCLCVFSCARVHFVGVDVCGCYVCVCVVGVVCVCTHTHNTHKLRGCYVHTHITPTNYMGVMCVSECVVCGCCGLGVLCVCVFVREGERASSLFQFRYIDFSITCSCV